MGEREKVMKKKKNRNKKPRYLKLCVLYNIILRYGLWEEKRNRDWRSRRWGTEKMNSKEGVDFCVF